MTEPQHATQEINVHTLDVKLKYLLHRFELFEASFNLHTSSIEKWMSIIAHKFIYLETKEYLKRAITDCKRLNRRRFLPWSYMVYLFAGKQIRLMQVNEFYLYSSYYFKSIARIIKNTPGNTDTLYTISFKKLLDMMLVLDHALAIHEDNDFSCTNLDYRILVGFCEEIVERFEDILQVAADQKIA